MVINFNNVLILAAHPDDEVLGCGGKIAKLIDTGAIVHVAFLADGVFSRTGKQSAQQLELTVRRNAAQKACEILGLQYVSFADLKRGLEALKSGTWDYVFTVTDFSAPIFRSFQQTAEGGLEMFFPENFTKRSQDLPNALHDAGQFYWGRPEAWLQNKHIFDRHSAPIIIPRWRVQDIDTQEDWERAEILAPIIMARKD
jgi:LmbE family N-acetylglucosaminyl deacetylase